MKIEHIDRLSRGQKSGAAIGSRSMGHHLRQHERIHYNSALKKGYLELDGCDRENLWNLWEKVCLARNTDCWVLIKELSRGKGKIFKNGELYLRSNLKVAKKTIKLEASNLAK